MSIGNAFLNSITGGGFMTGLLTPNILSAKMFDGGGMGMMGMMGMWGGGYGWGMPYCGYGMGGWGMNPMMWGMY